MAKVTYGAKKRKQKNSKLPLFIIIGGALLLILTTFFALRRQPAAAFQSEVKGAPSIKVDKDNVDLGKMKLGDTARVSFQVTNVGDKPLRFTEAPYIEVKEGC